MHRSSEAAQSSGTVRLPHGDIAFDRYGNGGEPILLLHGIPGNRQTWAAVAPLLARRYTVLVPDLPGFGGSVDLSGRPHAAEYAACIVEFMKAVGVAPVHLVGHDFGGPIAVLAAQSSGVQVRSLALCATNTFTDTPIPFPLRIASVPYLGAAAFRLFFGDVGLHGMWAAATRNKRAYPMHSFRASLRPGGTVRNTRRILFDSMRDLPGLYRAVEMALPRVIMPALVIWPDRDPFFPVAVGERTAGAMKRAKFTVIEGCGHFVPQEAPEVLAQHLSLFFASVTPISVVPSLETNGMPSGMP